MCSRRSRTLSHAVACTCSMTHTRRVRSVGKGTAARQAPTRRQPAVTQPSYQTGSPAYQSCRRRSRTISRSWAPRVYRLPCSCYCTWSSHAFYCKAFVKGARRRKHCIQERTLLHHLQSRQKLQPSSLDSFKGRGVPDSKLLLAVRETYLCPSWDLRTGSGACWLPTIFYNFFYHSRAGRLIFELLMDVVVVLLLQYFSLLVVGLRSPDWFVSCVSHSVTTNRTKKITHTHAKHYLEDRTRF